MTSLPKPGYPPNTALNRPSSDGDFRRVGNGLVLLLGDFFHCECLTSGQERVLRGGKVPTRKMGERGGLRRCVLPIEPIGDC